MSYDILSEERKKLQEQGLAPMWWSTPGYQLFKEKYQWTETPRQQYEAIANTLAKHTPEPDYWSSRFFNLLWSGWLSPATPVLGNAGTERGLTVSCTENVVADSIDGFYGARWETALLTKYGFGTASYLGDIRPRGSPIKNGGKAEGILPVLKGFVQMSREVTQGSQRRGAWAGYIPIDHGDFWEILRYLEKEPANLNIGWNVTDAFLAKMNSGDTESISRWQHCMRVKMIHGKGYFTFVDKCNRKLPEHYKRNGMVFKSMQLCNEILLPSDKDHSYSCVLSSLNLARYDEWKDTNAVFEATVFLDCVASEFLEKARNLPGTEKVVRFTEKARALGLGVCGFHTYVQQQGWDFDGMATHLWNTYVFKKIHDESLQASKWMAECWGAPEWSDGTVRNCSRIAIAPTKSTALIMGGVSEGINPDPAMVFAQSTAGGEVYRVNPVLLNVMKAKGIYSKKLLKEINSAYGSIQGLDQFTDEEKATFKTAFEVDPRTILRLAKARARYIDQWQSLNLFFSADESAAYIAEIHQEAFMDEDILGLYYVYSKTGIKGSVDKSECQVCQ